MLEEIKKLYSRTKYYLYRATTHSLWYSTFVGGTNASIEYRDGNDFDSAFGNGFR